MRHREEARKDRDNYKGRITEMIKEIKMSDENRWRLWMACKYALVVLVIILYTVLIARAAQAKAERRYSEWKVRYVNEYLDQMEAAERGMPLDPKAAQLEADTQMLAKVLYGIKDNSSDDMRTLCWCVFNRVDSPDYPGTIAEVVEQPQQWMRYSPDNPVLENIYRIASEELDAWQNGTTRPCGIDLVYMNWSPSEVTLRNTWTNTSKTYYWRAGK